MSAVEHIIQCSKGMKHWAPELRFPLTKADFPSVHDGYVINQLGIFDKKVAKWGFPVNPWGIVFEEWPGWFPVVVVFDDRTGKIFELKGNRGGKIWMVDAYHFLFHSIGFNIPSGNWLNGDEEQATPEYLKKMLSIHGPQVEDVIPTDLGEQGTVVSFVSGDGQIRFGRIPTGKSVGIISVMEAFGMSAGSPQHIKSGSVA